jgi:hypothetical protein
LVKGICQLVKYQALLAAERGHGSSYPVDIYLGVYSFPEDIPGFARKFGIVCHIVAEKAVL